MIPKKIHYCWFGNNPKPKEILQYIESWKKYCPEYEIIEWNETNYDISSASPYAQRAYKNKKWAFFVDYVRFDIIYKHGGIYMDSDVEVFQNLDMFLQDEIFFGFQDEKYVDGAIFGSVKQHIFIKEILEFYQNYTGKKYFVLPYLVTKKLKKHGLKKKNSFQTLKENISIYPKNYFYPFAYYEDKTQITIGKDSYAAHWYKASWLPNWVVYYYFPVIRIWKKYFKI